MIKLWRAALFVPNFPQPDDAQILGINPTSFAPATKS
jgi:hypothetical protein